MSETYRALTRKYRPRSFDDVVSQEHIINTLRNAIEQNRISHAYLFCGPRGVGKTTMARVVARLINDVSLDIDGEELGRTLDIIEIDAASNSGVDDVRGLREGVRVPPQVGKYKVYIIDEVHMLSKPAFNALLKTLEEPPEHVKFIFATTEPHKVLPTVMSRVQRFDFRRIKVGEIVDRLRYICEQEKIKIDDASLHLIGRKADGALRDALSILDQVIAFCGDDIKYDAVLHALNAINNDRLFELMECAVHKDAASAMRIVHDLLLQGHDIQEFLVALTEHLRNMYFSRFTSTEGTLLEVPEEEKDRLRSSTTPFTEQDLLRMLHLTSEAQVKIRDSQQPRVLLEITILKLVTMDRSEGLSTLLAELRELKKKTDVTGSVAPDNTKSESRTSHNVNKTVKGEEPQPTVLEDVKPKLDSLFGAPAIKKSNGAKTTAHTVSSSAAKAKVSVHPKGDTISTQSDIIPSQGNSIPSQGNSIPSQGNSTPSLDNTNTSQGNSILSKDAKTKDSRSPAKLNETGMKSAIDVDTLEMSISTSVRSSKSDDTLHIVQTEVSQRRTTSHTTSDVAQSVNLVSETTPISRELVESRYQEWIDQVTLNTPRFVALSLIKTRLLSTGPDFIVIECQDKLVEQLVNEHQTTLSSCLHTVIQRNVSIKTSVIRSEQHVASNDPYATLKKLQQEQPIVKTIVDVLGAELEY